MTQIQKISEQKPFWTPAFAGVTGHLPFYEIINPAGNKYGQMEKLCGPTCANLLLKLPLAAPTIRHQ